MLNLSYILLFCIFFLPIIGNSQVYKWIDKDGKIHYSDKPPLDLSVNVDELTGLNEKKDKSVDGKVREINLHSLWWSKTQKGIRTLDLLDNGVFKIYRWSYKHNRLHILRGGRWKEENNSIILTYTTDPKYKTQSEYIGLSEALKIVKITSSRLSVVWPNNTQHDYIRLNEDNYISSYKADLLGGEWRDSKNNKVEFSYGKVTITPRTENMGLGDFGKYLTPVAVGNWHLSERNTLLNIEFVYNFSFSARNIIGATQVWEIESINESNLTLRHAYSRKSWLLTKKSR